MPPTAPSAPAPPAAPAAPVKPTGPTPAAPAPPAKPAAPPPKEAFPIERPQSEWMDEVNADIDALADETPRPAPKRVEPPARPAQPKPAVDPKLPAQPQAGAVPPEEPDGGPANIRDLRAVYKEQKAKLQEYEPKIQKLATLEARIKELEGGTGAIPKDVEEKLKAAEQRRDELEKQIAFYDYTASSEYQDNHEKPYVEAWAKARKDLKQIYVETEDGNQRAAVDDDLIELCNMELGPAQVKANAKFGDLADTVMRHRERILDIVEKQDEAKANAKKTAVERAQTQRRQMQQAWQQTNQALSQKYPKTFGKIEDDAEGNALLDKGFALADRLFAPTSETAPKTAEEKLYLDALIRNRVANHDRAMFWLKKARTEITSLKEQLKAFETSEPGGGLGGQPDNGARVYDLDDANAEIDALSRKG